jgi:mannose-6-phosphate isomerase-like protein (cupin superfamily)
MQATLVEHAISTPAGFMAPLHAHAAAEAVRVLEGSIVVFAGSRAVRLARGEAVVVPQGVAHTFRSESSGTRVVFGTSTPSAGRYEDFLRAVGQPDSGWAQAEDAAAVAAVAGATGVTVLGPPGMLPADAERPARAA